MMSQNQSLKESLSVHDLVVVAAMSGLDHLLAEVMAESPITPETRRLALQLAQDGGRASTVSLLTLH